MIIQPIKTVNGELYLPGDKSISHRAAMLAALAAGNTQISNFASSADCAATLDCLQRLGVRIERDGTNVLVEGAGKNGFQKPKTVLDCQNSGTTVRLLSGILAGQDFTSVLTGDDSLKTRPMRRVIEPLELMTVEIQSNNNRLPMEIRGKNNLQAITYVLPVASAQVKSCVLLAGLNAAGITKIQSPKSASANSMMRDHTERMLEWFGARIENRFFESPDKSFVHETSIEGESKLIAKGPLEVPGDVSSAAFFLVAAASLKNSKLVFKKIGLNPTRTKILDVLREFGAQIKIYDQQVVNNELIGSLEITGGLEFSSNGKHKNILRGEIIAGLIDELPILAVIGTQLENGLEIRDAGELRVKESDRISTTIENLRRMNAIVEEFPDGMRIEKSDLQGAQIEPRGDHRIAMAFSIAGLLAKGETEIQDSDCVKVSFPEFFTALKNICQ